MTNEVSRRDFLTRSLSIGAAGVVAGAFLSACGKKEGGDPCADESKLTGTEKTVRKSTKYVAKSPHKDKLCDNCLHWIDPEAGSPCGGCKVVKGPIAAKGHCNLWAKKT